jgi:uncharacterized membrane protein YccC
MTSRAELTRKAKALMERLRLTDDHLLGVRFAINIFIGANIVWYTLKALSAGNPIWAIASMAAASDPVPEEARRMFRSRLLNVLVGCAVGFCLLLFGGHSDLMVPFALAVTVLVSSYVIRIKTMWRQAPITAAIVIAAGVSHGSTAAGMGSGLRKVAAVLFGCVVGLLVSLLMSKIWPVRQPAAEGAAPAAPTR